MDLNNLNASLHSVISGRGDTNIPFADDEVSDSRKSSDSITSNDSFARKAANYRRGLPERRGVNLRLLTNHRNGSGNESSDESDGSENERRDKPGPLKTDNFVDASNLGVMRRNSISMPVLNENDLEKLRELRMSHLDSGGGDEDDTMSREDLNKSAVVVSWLCL